MSTLVDFFRSSLHQLHGEYHDAIADLTMEQLHWRANEHGLPIAFVLWHYYRTQDNIIQFVIRRKPTVWLDEGLDQKLGLDRIAQGTGMSLREAQALRINSKGNFLAYMDAVAEATGRYLTSLDDQALEQKTTVRPLGEIPVRNAIGTMCLTHGFTHLGEIQHLRGLQGLRGMGGIGLRPNCRFLTRLSRLVLLRALAVPRWTPPPAIVCPTSDPHGRICHEDIPRWSGGSEPRKPSACG